MCALNIKITIRYNGAEKTKERLEEIRQILACVSLDNKNTTQLSDTLAIIEERITRYEDPLMAIGRMFQDV